MEIGLVERYLSRKLPEAEGLKVVRLRRSYPGVSRETWLVDAQWTERGQQVQRGFVFRRDSPAGSVCLTPLRREYEVYRRLQGTQVPVARTLWYETDAALLADQREFYVREKVEGRADIPHLLDPNPKYDALRIRVAKEHVEKLALVHTLDWRKLGFDQIMDVPKDEGDCARLDLEFWEQSFDRVRVEAFPTAREILCWLKDNPPPPAARIALIKGNNGMAEEIWQGARIVAMSDWEVAHLGDPAEDWCWMQVIPKLWDEQKLMAHYEEKSGIRLAPDSLRYYRVFRSLKGFIFHNSAARMLATGKDQRAAVAGLGLKAFQRLREIAEASGILD